MNQPTADRVVALEQRVNLLTYVVIIQGVVLAFALGLIPIAIISFCLLLPILALTHKWLPGLARRCGRFFSGASNRRNSSPVAADSAS